jgi:hypothetical protein
MNAWITRSQLGAIATSVWLVSGAAHGQNSVRDARELFKQARALVSEKKYSEACPLFEMSQSVESGIGTQFNLADCWEHIGRTASAYRLFLAVAETASANGEAERAKVATERAVALAPKLSRLQVRYESAAGEPRVFHENVLVEQVDWNRPAAVDPGLYRVELVSDGKVKWQTKVEVPPRSLTVLVTTPPSGNSSQATECTTESKPAPKPKPGLGSGQAERVNAPLQIRANPLPPQPQLGAEKRSSIWAPIAIVAGIGGIGAGTAFGLTYLSKNDQAKGICSAGTDCSDSDIAQHKNLVDSAKTARLGAYLGFGLGTACIAAATIYYATRRSATDYHPPIGLSVSPGIEPGRPVSWNVAAQGSF